MSAPLIAFDLRTLADPHSAARGIGQYALHHLEALARLNGERGRLRLVGVHGSAAPDAAWAARFAGLDLTWMPERVYLPGSFDLVHVPDPMGLQAGYASPLGFFSEPRVTALFHDLIPLTWYREQMGTGWPAYLARLELWKTSGAHFLCNSSFTARELGEALEVPSVRLRVVGAGLNRSGARASDLAGLRDRLGLGADFALFVGSPDAHKNFETVLKAVLRVQAERPLQLAVTGLLNARGEFLRRELEAAGLGGLVRFTGHLEDGELLALYGAASALLCLSRSEGFGFPVLEAMAAGCPVICSDGGALPEVVGDAALVVRVDDVQGAADALLRVSGDPELRRDLVTRGLERAAAFTWKRVAERTLAAWETCLQEPPAEVGTRCRARLNWASPLFDPSGYASEARAFLLALEEAGWCPAVKGTGRHSMAFMASLEPGLRELFLRQLDRPWGAEITVHCRPAPGLLRSGSGYQVGRTTFETDSLPEDWLARCSAMDELWVPSFFNVDTFRDAGVRVPILRMPQGVDTARFRPGLEPLLDRRGFAFLAVFEWSFRKGWDLLLGAWAEAFGPGDEVELLLRCHPPQQVEGDAGAWVEARIDDFLATLGRSRSDCAPIRVLGEQLAEAELPRLYASADVYVAPSRGEGWGRPLMEAMSSGLPVIATRWGGHLDFMDEETAWLLDLEGLELVDEREEQDAYLFQRWARPSQTHLVELLRRATAFPEEGRRLGRRAREAMVKEWDWDRIAPLLVKRLEEIRAGVPVADSAVPRLASPGPRVPSLRLTGEDLPLEPGEPIPVVWEGAILAAHSLAGVNRTLVQGLMEGGQVALSLVLPEEEAGGHSLERCDLGRPAKVHVRHQWPPSFVPPREGAWVMVQPWEFGGIPEDWVRPMREQVDEIWVPTEAVREGYVRSGIPETKVVVVPHGVDPVRFSPDGPSFPLRTRKPFRFLFLGGTIRRKGIDILLRAYVRAFRRTDGVCLVIKGFPGPIYPGSELDVELARMAEDPQAPEIEYLDEVLGEAEVAALYRSCQTFVLPYRGEGFGLPLAEAMASGLPLIVTAAGASRDFVPPEAAYLLPSMRLPMLSVDGMLPSAAGFWLEEPDEEALVSALRRAFEHPEEAAERGRAGRMHAVAALGWGPCIHRVEERLRGLAQRGCS
nr:glycosyltransferase [uncultured Holophaga sp.]